MKFLLLLVLFSFVFVLVACGTQTSTPVILDECSFPRKLKSFERSNRFNTAEEKFQKWRQSDNYKLCTYQEVIEGIVVKIIVSYEDAPK